METLSLNQKILVQSSCYFGGQIIELDKTSVYDVIDGRVTMEKNNNWGACPTRSREEVISTEEEAEALFNARFERYKKSDCFKESDVYLVKDDEGRNSVSIFNYRKRKSENSLRNGTREVYDVVGSSSSCYYTQTTFEFPQGSTQNIFCNTLEEALAEFKTKIVNNL